MNLFPCFVLELSAVIILVTFGTSKFFSYAVPFYTTWNSLFLQLQDQPLPINVPHFFKQSLSHNLVLTVTSLVSLRGYTFLDLRYQPLNTALLYVKRATQKIFNV